ncbi:putative F-box domain, galactose oxidase, beta-propeller [Medicago truncatula]|uniref:Galactose oxidase/kelch repeat protein n=1 Tax=Medicago truncatula TaxID=3880 RepID=G7INS5_MEDTR|nr:F-box/kelch-repeat protein At1g22040 [Medicago truncatula]AES63414.1 galactose oxidase/kelch repeat protein [Medicago truncatula]RHN71629.1 putative F-box domain, galactose oxidase, beta-propeller [Medicago truncatula]
MGNIIGPSNAKARRSAPASEIFPGESCKRQRLLSTCYEDDSRLIPSLPDEISAQILARVPRIHYLNLKSVSRAWKAALASSELFCLRKELGTTEEWLYILTKVNDNKLLWYALDPISGKWQRLPPMPNVFVEDEAKKGLAAIPHRMWSMLGSSIKIADVIMKWFIRKDALDQMPFCGCSIGAVDGCIYALGGFSKASAMKSVWRYDPVTNSWTEGSPMSVGRAYSKTGVLNNKLYVVGGVTRGRGGLNPLQSAEVYDPHTGTWSQLPNMPFAKAQVLPTAFLADLLKPIATGMTSYRGRLFVPQSLYCWPFFVDVGGEVYDPDINSWLEMPGGMGDGWPARQAGTKLSVTVNNDLYALDPSSSLNYAKIKVYDEEGDTWKVVAGDVPIHDFADSESPYLLASLLGKLHVITKDANHNIAVLQANMQNELASSQSMLSSPDSERAESSAESETEIWKVFASRSGRSSELVSCQSLKV